MQRFQFKGERSSSWVTNYDSVVQSNLLECVLLQSQRLSEFLKMKLTIVILKHRDAQTWNLSQLSRRRSCKVFVSCVNFSENNEVSYICTFTHTLLLTFSITVKEFTNFTQFQPKEGQITDNDAFSLSIAGENGLDLRICSV